MDTFTQIPLFPAYYINEDGIVVSHKFKPKVVLKPSLSTKGYPQVLLYIVLERHTVTVHYLMGITFLDLKDNEIIDHKDNNKLNTKLSNLQKSNYRHNTSKDANNLYSKLQGVSYYKKTGKYVAQIRIKGKLKYLGTFDTDIEASEKYNNYLKNYNNGTV